MPITATPYTSVLSVPTNTILGNNTGGTAAAIALTPAQVATMLALISDTAYDATTWNAVTGVAPSKNAVRDQFEALSASISAAVSDTAYNATTWNGVTTIAPSKNAVRDAFQDGGVSPLFSGLTVTNAATIDGLHLGSSDGISVRLNDSADMLGLTTGTGFTAVGYGAGAATTSGSTWVAAGLYSLSNNTTGDASVAVGVSAGTYQADGATPLTDADFGLYLGYMAKGFNNTDNHAIVIGAEATGESATGIVIGSTYNTVSRFFGTPTYSDGADSTKKLTLNMSGITTGTTRTLTAPNASGTIALTSDLTSYLPLSGGTITGSMTIQSGVLSLVVGADGGATTLTDATQKITRFGQPHYTNAEEPAAIVVATAGASANALNWGGGTASMNAATLHRWYAAATSTTTTGTSVAELTSTAYTLKVPLWTVQYDGSNYFSTTVGSTGGVTFDAVGAGAAFTFSDAVNSTSSIKSTNATAGIGYGTGAGGTVTQATSKATGVTLNKTCGTITMNGAALAADTTVSFTVTNSACAATDVIAIQHDSVGTLGAYLVVANTPAAGSFQVSVRNVTAGSLSEAIVLRFAIIKAVTS